MWVKIRSSSHLFFSRVPRPGIEEFYFWKQHDLKSEDEGVNEFVDEEVKEYVDEGVNKFVDESINIDVNEFVEDYVYVSCNEDLVMEVDSGLGGFETVNVTILEHSEVTVVPVSGLTVERDSSSVSSLIPPSIAALSLNTLATTSSTDVFLSQWIYTSNEGKTELWPQDNISSHCTMRDGISSN